MLKKKLRLAVAPQGGGSKKQVETNVEDDSED